MKKPALFSTKRKAIEDAKKTVLLTVVVGAILVSGGLVTTNFLFDLSRYNARVIKEKETAVDSINDNLIAVDDLIISFNAFEEGPDLLPGQGDKANSSVILDSLPSKYDYPALATTMELLATKSGLRLESFGGQDESDSAIQSAVQPQSEEIPFSLVLTGKYVDVQEFMNTLHTTIRPIRIDAIEISGSDQSIRAEVKLRTYYQPSVSLDVETKVVQ